MSLDELAESWRQGQRPDPRLTVSEWADRHRKLSARASAEPGPWRTDRTPYLREIMDCLSPSSPVQRVAFMKGAQVGGTECGNNWIGFVIHHAPGPMLAVLPTVEMAKRNSKTRLDPLIEDSPALQERIRPSRARDSGNTVLTKEFPGGVLSMTGANSAVGLRSMPVRDLFLDEVDGYPGDVEGEGDPIALAEARTRTFARRKIFLVSTPTVAGQSRIAREYEASDQRRYFVPCPHCDHMQWLKFERLRWPEGKPLEAEYQCEGCGAGIAERHKADMLARGEWRATSEHPSATAGFHLSSLYSPPGWRSWGEIAAASLAAEGHPEALKTFHNTDLGEAWEEPSDAPAVDALLRSRIEYRPGTVPPGALQLTGMVDVQSNRLEWAVYGWGIGLTGWLIDYGQLPGDTGTDAPWKLLDKVLRQQFPDARGVARAVDAWAVDSGYATAQVYRYCRNNGAIKAFKGFGEQQTRNSLEKALVGTPAHKGVRDPATKARIGTVAVYPVNSWEAKGKIYAALRQTLTAADPDEIVQGALYFHQACDREFFEQLTSEYVAETQRRDGSIERKWKVRVGLRNEQLDLAAGCRALAFYPLRLDDYKPEAWSRLAAARGVPAEHTAEELKRLWVPAASVPARPRGLRGIR